MAKRKRDKYEPLEERLLDTPARDNEGNLLSVVLYLMTTNGPPRWILKILDTEGHWYLSTLLETHFMSQGTRPLSIDGKGRSVTNMADVLLDAVGKI